MLNNATIIKKSLLFGLILNSVIVLFSIPSASAATVVTTAILDTVVTRNEPIEVDPEGLRNEPIEVDPEGLANEPIEVDPEGLRNEPIEVDPEGLPFLRR